MQSASGSLFLPVLPCNRLESVLRNGGLYYLMVTRRYLFIVVCNLSSICISLKSVTFF